MSTYLVKHLRDEFAETYFPGDPTNPRFLGMLNAVLERFYNAGKWKGTTREVLLNINGDRRVLLPYRYESILSAQIDDRPRFVFPNDIEYYELGPGRIDPTTSGAGILVDEGEQAISSVDIATAGTVVVTNASATDDGLEVRVFGTDANGDEVLDANGLPGEAVTLVTTGVTTTNSFLTVTGFDKPTTSGRVTVAHNGTAPATTLVVLDPWEKTPQFHRYKVAAVGATTVRAICKLRFVPLTAEEDRVIPGNLGAIELGLMALNYERNDDIDRANAYWGSAYTLLNGELRQHQGGRQPVLKINHGGLGVDKVESLY